MQNTKSNAEFLDLCKMKVRRTLDDSFYGDALYFFLLYDPLAARNCLEDYKDNKGSLATPT